jgi:hypothetical protein
MGTNKVSEPSHEAAMVPSCPLGRWPFKLWQLTGGVNHIRIDLVRQHAEDACAYAVFVSLRVFECMDDGKSCDPRGRQCSERY